MFKKTLPGAAASLLEFNSAGSVRSRAAEILRRSKNPKIDFIALALHGKKIGFEKVITMIDDMVATLKQEQIDDDNKQGYCATQFDQSDDTKKSLERTISDKEAAIATASD